MNKVIFSFFLSTLIVQSQGSNFPDFVNIDYGGGKKSLNSWTYTYQMEIKIPIQW